MNPQWEITNTLGTPIIERSFHSYPSRLYTWPHTHHYKHICHRLMIAQLCKNRRTVFFLIQMFVTAGSSLQKWNKFLSMIAFEEESFCKKNLKRVCSCFDCIFLIITVCPSSASAHFWSQAHDFDAPSRLNTVYHFSRLFTLCYC